MENLFEEKLNNANANDEAHNIYEIKLKNVKYNIKDKKAREDIDALTVAIDDMATKTWTNTTISNYHDSSKEDSLEFLTNSEIQSLWDGD